LSKIIEKNKSGKKVLGLFILTNLVYAFMLMITIPNTMAFSNGMKLLDMMPTGYDFNYVNKLFNTLGNEGRKAYLTGQIPIDMIYPLLFGVSYCLLMAYFLKKINKHKTPFIYLCLLPIIAGIADYIENIGIITMLNNYPDFTETTVSVTNIFSVVKSISTSIFFLALVVILLLFGIKLLKKTK
jgi:mannose/fructose/N-acetylgalactosamine-specific phosphotransferase system component IID